MSEIFIYIWVWGNAAGRWGRYLVDDGGVLEVAQVEHAHGAVGAHGREHVAPAARAAERDVVHLLQHHAHASAHPSAVCISAYIGLYAHNTSSA